MRKLESHHVRSGREAGRNYAVDHVGRVAGVLVFFELECLVQLLEIGWEDAAFLIRHFGSFACWLLVLAIVLWWAGDYLLSELAG
jgi:hypothetical protein